PRSSRPRATPPSAPVHRSSWPDRSTSPATCWRRYRDNLQALSVSSMLFRASLALVTLMALPATAAAQDIPASCKGWERIAVHTEQITSGHFRLREKVEITCDTYKFFADEVDLYDDEDRLVATGNVLFTTPDTRISASRLDFNLETKTGTFYDAYGTSKVSPQV